MVFDMKRLFFLLLFFPVLSQAAQGWRTSYTQIFYSTPEAACQPFADDQIAAGISTGFSHFQYTLENAGYCRVYNRYGEDDSSSAYRHPISRVDLGCADGETYNFDLQVCEPEEPKQCEAGLELSRYFPARKTESGYLITDAPNPGCFGGCRYDNVLTIGKGGCVLGGETGHMCLENYISDGTECEVGDGGGDGGGGDGGGGDGDGEGGGGDGPGEDDPDGDPDPNCRRFTNADGSWGYDCSPRPDPDENNECPPGYQMQGNTCFRIPPEHPDYDPDKDPQKPGGDDDPDGGNGSGSGDGDLKGVAQETTLKSIDKTLKDIDGSIKSGNSTTHSLLQGIKDAIGKIPGGGGGSGNGNGSGAGDGDGEGGPTKPESGSFDEAIAEQDEAIEGFKEELKTKFNEFKQYQIEGLTLSGGGGSLPSVTVSFGMFGTHTLDFGQYAEPLSNLGGIFVFMCGLLAVLIIFVRG